MAEEIPILYILLIALGPPILYLLYVRSREKYRREPLSGVFRAFLFGGTISVAVAIILELVLVSFDLSRLGRPYQLLGQIPAAILVAVIIAPLVEEFTKAWGLPGIRWRISEPEDGLVYGAALGLGFAATENLFYELTALANDGAAAFYGTAFVRAISSTFLHATATGLVGWGYARAYLSGKMFRFLWVLPYYLGAVLLHGAFNLAASLQTFLGLAVAILGAIFLFAWMTRKIQDLDRSNPPPKFTPRQAP